MLPRDFQLSHRPPGMGWSHPRCRTASAGRGSHDTFPCESSVRICPPVLSSSSTQVPRRAGASRPVWRGALRRNWQIHRRWVQVSEQRLVQAEPRRVWNKPRSHTSRGERTPDPRLLHGDQYSALKHGLQSKNLMSLLNQAVIRSRGVVGTPHINLTAKPSPALGKPQLL